MYMYMHVSLNMMSWPQYYDYISTDYCYTLNRSSLCLTHMQLYTAVQSQKAVYAYFSSKQILLLALKGSIKKNTYG